MSGHRPVREQRRLSATVLRLPILGATYLLVIPLLWLIDKWGLSQSLLRGLGRILKWYGPWARHWRGYEARESDVFVCSYFKSGTNWGLQIAQQLIWRGRAEFDHIHDVVPWPDEVKSGFAIDVFDDGPAQASPSGKRVIKTHSAWQYIPYSKRARYLLIVRDPKDVFVSSYHFIRGAVLGPLMPSVQNWYEFYLSPLFPPGFWPEHATSYWNERDRENVLFLSFKEMKTDFDGTLEKVAAFLEIDLTEEEFERTAQRCGFDYMKSVGEKFAPGSLFPWSIQGTQTIRRGRQGAAGEMLSTSQQQRMDDTFRAALDEQGSDLEWERISSPPS